MSCASPLNSPQWLLPSDQIQTHRCSVVRTVTTHIVSGIFITSPLYLTCHHRATRRIVRKASEESSRRDPPQRKPQPPPPPPPGASGSPYCASSQRRVVSTGPSTEETSTATTTTTTPQRERLDVLCASQRRVVSTGRTLHRTPGHLNHPERAARRIVRQASEESLDGTIHMTP